MSEERKYRREDEVPRTGPAIPIVRVRANQQLQVICLAVRPQGYYVHWNGMHSEGCTDPVEECDGHKRGFPLKWYAYLHCWLVRSNGAGLLELTPNACKTLKECFPVGESLRGKPLMFTRGNGPKARLNVGFLEHSEEIVRRSVLPKERDALPILSELWNLAANKFKVRREDIPPCQ